MLLYYITDGLLWYYFRIYQARIFRLSLCKVKKLLLQVQRFDANKISISGMCMVLKWYIAHIKCQIKFLLKNKTIPKSNVSHLLKLVICLIKKAGRT